MTTSNDHVCDSHSSDCSSSHFTYRGIGFCRTSKGYWIFDSPPDECVAWERYGANAETLIMSNAFPEPD